MTNTAWSQKDLQWDLISNAEVPVSSDNDAYTRWGNRVVLPESVLASILSTGYEFNTATVLELSIGSGISTKRAFVGISEFNAPPNTVLVPINIRDTLELDSTSLVTVRLFRPPHATHLELEVEGNMFDAVDNIDSVLTSILPRQFVCLSKDQNLDLFIGRRYRLKVTDIKPEADAVLIINTNVQVSFKSIETITAPRTSVYEVPVTRTTTTLQNHEPSLNFKLPANFDPTTAYLEAKVSCPENSKDPLIVAIGPDPSGNIGDAYWIKYGTGTTFIPLLLSNLFDPSDISDAVVSRWQYNASQQVKEMNLSSDYRSYGFPESAVSKLSDRFYVTVISSISDELPRLEHEFSVRICPILDRRYSGDSPTPPLDTEGTKECPNCHSRVPLGVFATHSAVCARSNVRCSHAGCGQVFRRGSEALSMHQHCSSSPTCSFVGSPLLESLHAAAEHGSLSCRCGSAFPSLQKLRIHRRQECPRRRISCPFCSDFVASEGPADDAVDRFHGLCAHEARCGSRTRTCGLCTPRKAVLMKQWNEHCVLYHPTMSSTSAGGAGSTASGGVCPMCTFINKNGAIQCEMCNSPLRLGVLAREESVRSTQAEPRVGQFIAQGALPAVGSEQMFVDDEDDSPEIQSNASAMVQDSDKINSQASSAGSPHSTAALGIDDNQLGHAANEELEPMRDNVDFTSDIYFPSYYPDGKGENWQSSANPNRSTPLGTNRQEGSLPPSKKVSCHNACCLSMVPVIRKSKLCNRCLGLINESVFEAPDEELAGILEHSEPDKDQVFSLIQKQLKYGCSGRNCENPACFLGRMNLRLPSINSKMDAAVRHLLQLAGNHTFYFCVSSNQKKSVPEGDPLAAFVDSSASQADPLSKGFKQSTRTKSKVLSASFF